MRAIWENNYERLIQAVYTEDYAFTRNYGSLAHEGVLNSLKMALDKKTSSAKVYRIEDDLGVIIGFSMLDFKTGKILESHVRPNQRNRQVEFYAKIDSILRTSTNYESYILNECEAINSCAFIKSSIPCNYMPMQFKMVNGVLQYKFAWNESWNQIFNTTSSGGCGKGKGGSIGIELRKFEGCIQWKEKTSNTWQTLYCIDEEFEMWDLKRVNLVATADEQTNFTIPEAPYEPEVTFLYINGEKRTYGKHYTISGTNLQYIATDYEIEADDDIDFYYKKLDVGT